MHVTRLEVACATDVPYLPHCAAMLCSLITGSGMPVRAHLLIGDDIAPDECARLSSMVDELGAELVVHRVQDRRLGALKTTATFPTAHWYRVALPELLPDLDRVLYLDCDLLVLDSLSTLWTIDLEGQLLGAVTNVFPDRDGEAKLCAGIGLKPGEYFNSGVLLLDLAAMRAERISERVITFAEENRELLFLPDGDALNAVLADRRLPLHPRWNCLNAVLTLPWSNDAFGADAVAEARRRPAVRHFEGGGSNKPWHPDADPDDRRTYLSFRERTPWPRPGEGPAGA